MPTYETVSPGIRRYRKEDGSWSYAVTASYKGRRETGTARTLTEARDLKLELAQRLRTGGRKSKAGRRMVADAIARHLKGPRFADLTAKDQRQRRVALAWWEERIGTVPVRHLAGNPEILVDCRDDLAEELAPGTVNRRMTALSVALADVVELGWLPTNPLAAIRRMRERPELGEVLTDAEVRELLVACRRSPNRRLQYLVPCLLSCGARISEYLGTRAADIDAVRGTSLIRDGKTGTRVVHYHGRGLEALREAMQVVPISGLLWAGTRGKVSPPSQALARAKAAAGITKPGGWHLLRRTSGSWLAALGASEYEVQQHLGHSPGSPATARYVQLGRVLRSELAREYVRRLLAA